MKISKLKVLALLVVIVLTLSACSKTSSQPGGSNQVSDEKSYKFIAAHILNTESSFHLGMEKFKEEVEKNSNGRITIEIHPNGELGGNEDELVRKMATGTVDIIVAAPGFMAQSVEEVDLFSVPYLFESHDHWTKVVNGEPGTKMTNIIEDKTDFKVLGYWKDGVRNVYSIKPVREVADLKDMKLRIQNSPVLNEFWSALGTQPTFIAFNEIYQAFQNKVIDGAENAYSSIIQQKHYESCRYLTLTEHDIATRFFLMADKKFQDLPDDLKKIIDDAGKVASDYEIQEDFKVAESAKTELISEGVEIIEVDKMPFIEKTEDVRINAAKRLGLTELYNEINSLK